MAKIRDLNTLMGMLDRGHVIREANGQLSELLQVLSEMGSEEPKKNFKGSLNIKVEVALKDGVATISATVEKKVPKRTPGAGLFWVDGDGELTTEHPQQDDMFKPRDVGERGRADIHA